MFINLASGVEMKLFSLILISRTSDVVVPISIEWLNIITPTVRRVLLYYFFYG